MTTDTQHNWWPACKNIRDAAILDGGAGLIAVERYRQRSSLTGGEGWSNDHDDEHQNEELRMAAVVYAAPDLVNSYSFWPFSRGDYKPNEQPRPGTPALSDLVRAGALIAAEIDRRLRAGERLA